MRFEISHSLTYSYSAPVFIEPMTVRLRPRCDWVQHVEQFLLEVEPNPAGMSECIDIDGNDTAMIWFDGPQRSLSISASSCVEVLATDPFDFIVTDEGVLRLPATYNRLLAPALGPYLWCRHSNSYVDTFVRRLVEEAEGETTRFLLGLACRIHDDFVRESREVGDPLAPEETLSRRKGSCRDLAFLFVEACRSVGLAARFVSGYGYREDISDLEKRHMHAWAEVYLPGGGWRGFDPSIGLAVCGQHVAVAAAADPPNASPTSGTFRGSGVQSDLKYRVQIQCFP